MATRQQLKALRKKHHLGEFRKKSSSTKVSKSRGHTMAKRRKSYRAKTSHRSSGIMGRVLKVAIPAGVSMLYGAFRKPIADAMPNIPGIENYSDEAILGGGALLAQILIPNKYVSMVSKPIANIELARVGEKIKLGIPLGNAALSGNVSQPQSLAGYI